MTAIEGATKRERYATEKARRIVARIARQARLDNAQGRPVHRPTELVLMVFLRICEISADRPLSDHTIRRVAATLLAAAKSPADGPLSGLQPEWLLPEDAEGGISQEAAERVAATALALSL